MSTCPKCAISPCACFIGKPRPNGLRDLREASAPTEEKQWNRGWAFLTIVGVSALAWWGIIHAIREIWR